MTDRELIQQALNALESSRVFVTSREKIKHPEGTEWYDERIQALRARLSQPEEKIKCQHKFEVDEDAPLHSCCQICGEVRKQPEQEPVAWMYDWYDETEDIDGVPIGGIVSDCISKDYDEAHSPTMGCHNIRPLYTAPPQRKFIGLTDEDIEQIHYGIKCKGIGAYSTNDIYRAIEAKLKAKNGY